MKPRPYNYHKTNRAVTSTTLCNSSLHSRRQDMFLNWKRVDLD